MTDKTKMAIFASGAGTNAQKIIEYFAEHTGIEVALVVCNKAGAGVLGIAANYDIDSLLIERDQFFNGDAYLNILRNYEIDFIVLAGFLWKIPGSLIEAWPKRIINIHPALLPKFGGKGMYGQKVHEAVIADKEAESGISIHYVDEVYDNGAILLQEKCAVEKDDTPESLAGKIHLLEYQHYAITIEKMIAAIKNAS